MSRVQIVLEQSWWLRSSMELLSWIFNHIIIVYLEKEYAKRKVFSQIVPPTESITSAELQALNRRWNGSSYDQQETLKKHSLVFKTHKI